MLFQRIQKRTCKTKVALHKLFRILRTVYTRQIEHKIRFGTVLV